MPINSKTPQPVKQLLNSALIFLGFSTTLWQISNSTHSEVHCSLFFQSATLAPFPLLGTVATLIPLTLQQSQTSVWYTYSFLLLFSLYSPGFKYHMYRPPKSTCSEHHAMLPSDLGLFWPLSSLPSSPLILISCHLLLHRTPQQSIHLDPLLSPVLLSFKLPDPWGMKIAS